MAILKSNGPLVHIVRRETVRSIPPPLIASTLHALLHLHVRPIAESSSYVLIDNKAYWGYTGSKYGANHDGGPDSLGISQLKPDLQRRFAQTTTSWDTVLAERCMAVGIGLESRV